MIDVLSFCCASFSFMVHYCAVVLQKSPLRLKYFEMFQTLKKRFVRVPSHASYQDGFFVGKKPWLCQLFNSVRINDCDKQNLHLVVSL